MQFTEDHTVFILPPRAAHDNVLLEGGDPIGPLNLLKPGQAILVGGKTGNHVIVTIPIHVIGKNLCSAPRGKCELVRLPRLLVRGGLLKPAVLVQDIGSPISIHITHTHAVAELLRGNGAGHRVEGPFLQGIIPVHCCITKLSAPRADQFRPLIAHEVGQGG